MVYTTSNKLTQILRTRKGSTFGVAGITIFMIVSMLLLAILPAYRSITDQLKNNEVKLIYLNDLKTKRAAMDKLYEEYTTEELTIKKFENYYSSLSNSEVILANLSEIAKRSNVTLDSVAFGNPVVPKDANYSVLPGLLTSNVSIIAVGNINSLSTFIKNLETYPQVINIKSLAYQHHDENRSSESNAPILNNPIFDLSIDGFYFIWSE